MAIDDKVRDEKLQYDINNKNICIMIRKKMINVNILQVKKYYLLIKKQ